MNMDCREIFQPLDGLVVEKEDSQMASWLFSQEAEGLELKPIAHE